MSDTKTKKFWDNFYKKFVLKKKSYFANFVNKNFLKKNEKI
jgi:hypothetical protein